MESEKKLTASNYLFVPINNIASPNVNFLYFGWHKCCVEHTNYSSIKRDYTLHIILSGKGYYNVNGKKYELHKNDVFLINPAELVNYFPDKNDPWEYIWVGFNGEGSRDLIQSIGLSDTLITTLNTVDFAKSALQEFKNFNADPFNKGYGMLGTFFVLIENIIHYRQKLFSQVSTSNILIKKAIDYIDKNYDKEITVENLSNHLFVERTTLYKLFKANFGISPQKYIITFRLRAAQQYICETDMPFATIAQKCGFFNYSHFCRSFTSYFGTSPTEVRSTNIFGIVQSNEKISKKKTRKLPLNKG